jgi:hypothetical protein
MPLRHWRSGVGEEVREMILRRSFFPSLPRYVGAAHSFRAFRGGRRPDPRRATRTRGRSMDSPESRTPHFMLAGAKPSELRHPFANILGVVEYAVSVVS